MSKRIVGAKNENPSQYAASVTNNESLAFSDIVTEMEWKVALRRQELRFNCINVLPDGPTKSKLLLDFLKPYLFPTQECAPIANEESWGLHVMLSYYYRPFHFENMTTKDLDRSDAR